MGDKPPGMHLQGAICGILLYFWRENAMTRCCLNLVRFIVVLDFALAALNRGNAQTAVSQVKLIELSPGITIVNDGGVFKREWNPATISPEYNSFGVSDCPHPLDPLLLLNLETEEPPATVDSHRPMDLAPKESPATLSHDTVSPNDVLALVRALVAPVIGSPTLSNLGITPAWLAAHADDVAEHFGTLGETNDENQQQFIRNSFTDMDLIRRIIPRVFGATWTDDFAVVQVSIRFSNGRTLSAEAASQRAFMLPWSYESNGKKTRTYNADISRAVAELLPDGTVNRERLQGRGLVDQIRFEMPGSIRQKWQGIGANDKAGEALARLQQRYTIRRSEVSDHIGLHFGPNQWTPGVETLQADVRLASFPPNLVVAAAFPLEDGKAIGVDTFLREGERYQRVVLDNPWIMASLKKHAERGAWLIFTRDASMDDKAMQIFLAEMHAKGRDDLGREVSSHRREVASLSYYGDELIVFPDHHAIIWRWDPTQDLFEWPASAIKTDSCADNRDYFLNCTATVVDPNGRLEQ
jgi:hypothetical protein